MHRWVVHDTLDTLSEALQLHRIGRIEDAAALYRQVLAQRPEQPSALYLYGTLLMAQGDAAAEAMLERAAALRPSHAETLLALANARHRRGDRAGAMQAWGDVLAIEPAHVAASLNLAGCQRVAGDWRAAIQTCRAALACHPEHAGLWLALAEALLAGGCLAGAETAAESVIELDAGAAQAWLIRGTGRSHRRYFDGAQADLRRALELDPDCARAWLHLGNTLLDQDRLDAAEAPLRRAVELDPDLAEAHTSLGFLLSSRQDLVAAVACHDRAIALRPDFADAHSNRAAALLLGGHYAAGFAAYEWRKCNPLFAACYWSSDRPVWWGETLEGRRLLVFCEQGLGDTIMCARYLPVLAARGAAIVLVCAPALMPLLQGMPGIATMVARGEPRSGMRLAPHVAPPVYDCWIDQMSLPLACADVMFGAPGRNGYLHAEAGRVAAWHQRLPNGLRVGVAWAGNPFHSNDHRRSTTVGSLERVLAVEGVQFISLQMDQAEAARLAGLHVIAEELTDFAETAAAIACCDLIIAVDTSVAHLAGALGVPTWLMLAYAPEWRWLLEATDTPWYPAMRLFRQRIPGDWPGVTSEVAAALAALRQMSTK